MKLPVFAFGLLLLGLANAACSDSSTAPSGVLPTRAPAAPGIIVPASAACNLDLAKEVQRSFWPGSRLDPSVALEMALEQMDSLGLTTTSEVEPFLDEPEEPFSEDELPPPPIDEGYYSAATGEPCMDMYNGCIESCKKWKTSRGRQMCYIVCMGYLADCRAEQFLPPSLRGCWDIRTASYSPYGADYCDNSGAGWSSGGTGGCQKVFVIVEVNNGAGWETWWEGYATVCT